MQTEATDAVEESEVTAQLTAGETLRLQRESKGLPEKEVADRLHITVHYLRSIESNKYEKLPGEVFARGYIKSYAELLELDTDEILNLYQALVAEKRQKKE